MTGGEIEYLQIPLRGIDESSEDDIKNEMDKLYKLNTSFKTEGEYVDVVLDYLDYLYGYPIINTIHENGTIMRKIMKKDIYASNFYMGNRNITYKISHEPITIDDEKDVDIYESILIAFNVRKYKLPIIIHKPSKEIMDIIITRTSLMYEQHDKEHIIIHLNKRLLFKPTYQIAPYKADVSKEEEKYNINNFHNEYKKYVYAFRGDEIKNADLFGKFTNPRDLTNINEHNALSGRGIYLADLFIASFYSLGQIYQYKIHYDWFTYIMPIPPNYLLASYLSNDFNSKSIFVPDMKVLVFYEEIARLTCLILNILDNNNIKIEMLKEHEKANLFNEYINELKRDITFANFDEDNKEIEDNKENDVVNETKEDDKNKHYSVIFPYVSKDNKIILYRCEDEISDERLTNDGYDKNTITLLKNTYYSSIILNAFEFTMNTIYNNRSGKRTARYNSTTNTYGFTRMATGEAALHETTWNILNNKINTYNSNITYGRDIRDNDNKGPQFIINYNFEFKGDFIENDIERIKERCEYIQPIYEIVVEKIELLEPYAMIPVSKVNDLNYYYDLKHRDIIARLTSEERFEEYLNKDLIMYSNYPNQTQTFNDYELIIQNMVDDKDGLDKDIKYENGTYNEIHQNVLDIINKDPNILQFDDKHKVDVDEIIKEYQYITNKTDTKELNNMLSSVLNNNIYSIIPNHEREQEFGIIHKLKTNSPFKGGGTNTSSYDTIEIDNDIDIYQNITKNKFITATENNEYISKYQNDYNDKVYTADDINIINDKITNDDLYSKKNKYDSKIDYNGTQIFVRDIPNIVEPITLSKREIEFYNEMYSDIVKKSSTNK